MSKDLSQIEKAQIANILAKLKAGRVLSKSEEARVRAYEDAQKPAPEADAQDPAKIGTVQGLKAAAAILKRPLAAVKWAKSKGCPAFRHSRVNVGVLHAWFAEHEDEASNAADESTIDGAKLRIATQTARKLTMANDVRAGLLVEKAWVRSRHQIAAAKVAAFRAKSEAEHPVKFAACADDVAGCRSVLRGIWDEIAAALQKEMGEAFND